MNTYFLAPRFAPNSCVQLMPLARPVTWARSPAHKPRRSIAYSNAGGSSITYLVHQPHSTTRWRTAAVCGCGVVLTIVPIYQPSSGAADAERWTALPDSLRVKPLPVTVMVQASGRQEMVPSPYMMMQTNKPNP
jgi:hypothetical protein